MNIINIDVPDYVNYISEWNELQIPQGHFIMDKTITGCGFTEYFLHNQQNVVLCSPRKILLENKAEQNKQAFYVRNELEKTLEIDQDIDIKPNQLNNSNLDARSMFKLELQRLDEQNNLSYILQLKDRISQYIDQCFTENRPFKILVTYDSIKHVLEVLKNKFTPQAIDTIQFVVDEFQSIFSDARFKGNVELDFIDFLQDCSNICYLSATPMMEKYLEQMSEFKDLPYYKLIWPENKVIKAKIIRKASRSVISELGKIIEQYRKRNFPKKIFEDGSIHFSEEIVFYVNSVKTICSIVKKFGLTPSETNIICSRNDKNKKKLKTVKHDFGTIPLQGQEHKMFTFCTRTVYLGSDFYSKSASSIVISDCNINTLSVDIALDLPQILGRQRLSENVFRNECLLLYKTQDSPITKEQFEHKIECQKENSKNIYSLYEKGTLGEKKSLIAKIKEGLSHKYKIDFLSISSKTGLPAYNKLVELAEWRAWEVSQLDYQDDITMKKVLEDQNYTIEELNGEFINPSEINASICGFIVAFNEVSFFHEKMKVYCDFLDQYRDLLKTTDLPDVPQDYQNYVNLLGTKRVKALGYMRKNLEQEFQAIISTSDIKSFILSHFSVGSKLLLRDIKSRLQEIYDNLGVKKTAKASDLGEYFELKDIRIKMEDGKQSKGYELLKIKY